MTALLNAPTRKVPVVYQQSSMNKTSTTPRLIRELSGLVVYILLATHVLADKSKANPAADRAAFEKAAAGAPWAEVFSDGCTEDWKAKWFLDGEVGTVTNSPEAMTLRAGPEFRNDTHHMVLWTKDSFEGDLKIEYEYTRLDEAPNCVTILYIQATGSGEEPYAKDITQWSGLRKVPAMKVYFDHMNTYHISYAANPGSKDAYIRGRRYMPEKQGLKGTALKPDYFAPKLFATGVKHHITAIKKNRDLHVRVENPDQVVYCHMPNTDLPAITEGRIGLRHMFTRSARYANFRVSRPVPGVEAGTEPNIGKLRSELRPRSAESASFLSAAGPASGFSDAEIEQFRQNAAARCRATFEDESGKPFVPREIKKDWNDRGDFTRYYVQDVIHFATRALILNEQIDEANLALREMCRYHLDRPQTLLEIHSFPGAVRQLARFSLLYGPGGSRTKGLITKETHQVIVDTLWEWSREKSKLSDAEVEPWHTWTGHHSENHEANHFASCWAATLLLSRESGYRDQKFADGHTPTEHHVAWTAWVGEYLRQRGRKGMTVEIDSPSYSAATLGAITFIYDLAEEPELRRFASHYLTLAWALWAEQQINGVNGGAKTRCYSDRAKGAANPLSAAAWYVLGSDDHPKPKRPPAAAFLTSTWKMPAIVMNIAFDVSGRGSYEVIQRRPGLRPAEAEPKFKIHIASDAPALVRYTYATPDFMMGSLFCAPLPYQAWNAISSQNRWHGVIFSGDLHARIYPYCETNHSSYNAHWAIQKRGTLIAQKLKTSRHAKQHRVWFSREGLSEPIKEGSWYFAEANSAYAAVRVVSGEAAFEEASIDKRARILTCADDMSPVILEVARKADFPDFKTFRDTVQGLPFQFDGTILAYTGLSKDRFKFFADQSERPQINGSPIDLGPDKVYDSPFVQSDWDSGVVTIQFGDEKHALDFNGK